MCAALLMLMGSVVQYSLAAINTDTMGRKIYGALVHSSAAISIVLYDLNGRVCGALVQLCYYQASWKKKIRTKGATGNLTQGTPL